MKTRLLKLLPIVLLSLIFVFNNSPAVSQANGCGSGWKSRAFSEILTPESNRQFTPACNEHDICYETPGRSKLECDRAFRHAMMRTCDSRTGFNGIRCRTLAGTYHEALVSDFTRHTAENAYRDAQASARNAYFKIQNRAHGKCLNLQNANQNGDQNNTYDCTHHPDQEWKIENADHGHVRFRNHSWNKCLNLRYAETNGVRTEVWDCTPHPDQEWKIEDAGNGYVKIKNRRWGKCLNLRHVSGNGAPTDSWDCVSHPEQEWNIYRQR